MVRFTGLGKVPLFGSNKDRANTVLNIIALSFLRSNIPVFLAASLSSSRISSGIVSEGAGTVEEKPSPSSVAAVSFCGGYEKFKYTCIYIVLCVSMIQP